MARKRKATCRKKEEVPPFSAEVLEERKKYDYALPSKGSRYTKLSNCRPIRP